MTLAKEDIVLLGRVVGLFGVKGWVKVFSYTDPRQAILDYETWWLDLNGRRTQVRLAEGKRHGKSVIVRFDGVNDRDSAAGWLEADISVPRDQLPELEEGSFYWSDLEGLTVVNLGGDTLGCVEQLLETGAHDVLVVKGEQEILIPFVIGDIVKEVSLAEGLVRVDWEWD